MANKANDMDMCPVCLEDYEEEGNRVPRRLPCKHTFCEDCITLLVGNTKTFRCPECRTHLTTVRGAKHFQENKEILLHMKGSRNVSETMDHEDQELPCPTHGESMNLFCNEPACQLQICSECLFDEHNNHHVVELQSLKNESCETLRSYLGYLHKSLILKREQHFLKYKQFQSATNHGKFMKTAARIAHLNEIRKDMTKTLSYQGISNHIQTIRNMASTYQISLPDVAERYYHSYQDPKMRKLQLETENVYLPMDALNATPISKKEKPPNQNRCHPLNALSQEQIEIRNPKEESDDLYLPMGAFQTVMTKRSPCLSRKHQRCNQKQIELADEFSTLNISPNRRTNIYGNLIYTAPKTQERRCSVPVQSLNELLRESAKELESLDQEIYIPELRHGDTNMQDSVNFSFNNCSSQETEMGSREEPYMTMNAAIREVTPTGVQKNRRKVHLLDHRSGISFGIQDVTQSDSQETASSRRRHLNRSENPVNRNPEEQYVNLDQFTRECPTENHIYTSLDPTYVHMMGELDCAKGNIQEEKRKLLSLKEMSASKFSICQAKLKNDKEETLRKMTQMVDELYDELEKDIQDEKEKVTLNIDDDVVALDEKIDVVDNVRRNIMSKTRTGKDLDDIAEMVDNMVKQIKLHLQKKKNYSYLEYNKGEITRDHVQKFIGVITRKDTNFPC